MEVCGLKTVSIRTESLADHLDLISGGPYVYHGVLLSKCHNLSYDKLQLNTASIKESFSSNSQGRLLAEMTLLVQT